MSKRHGRKRRERAGGPPHKVPTESPRPSLERTYRRYRDASRRLFSQLEEDVVDEEAFDWALGLLASLEGREPDDLAEDEVDAVGVVAAYAYRKDGRTPMERFAEREGLSRLDRELLSAKLASRPSLHRVTPVEWPEVELEDLLGAGGTVRIVDRALSLTAPPGTLVFTRLARVGGITLTEGTPLAFEGRRRGLLLRRYADLAARVPSEDEDARLEIAFLRLYRTLGAGVERWE